MSARRKIFAVFDFSIHHGKIPLNMLASAVGANRLFAVSENPKSNIQAFRIRARENPLAFCALENDGFAGKRRAAGKAWIYHYETYFIKIPIIEIAIAKTDTIIEIIGITFGDARSFSI